MKLRLASIRLHPIKSLDPVSVTEARIGPGGGLELDRAWALYSLDGRWVNGKRTAAMHLIRATYAPDVSSVTLTVPGDRRNIPARTFAFPAGAEDAAEWFSVYFEQQSVVRFRVGEIHFEGSNPCARCPVPSRDPHSGADLAGFQKRFTELRRKHLPHWSPAARFDHFYRLATNTRVASSEAGKVLRVGD